MINPQYYLQTEGGGFNPAIVQNPLSVEFLIIDLFCGAGGTSTGFHNAKINGDQIAIVVACINHDDNAIKSHSLNHKDVFHLVEDIRTAELINLIKLLESYRKIYPNAKTILWASLECTNFSKAKGGQSRDADSRTLAEHLDRYVMMLNPDYVQIENVVEFEKWGPLDEFGKPDKEKSGEDFKKWCRYINTFGYRNEWKELNSADFGAYTSRNRLFGCFAKGDLPIVWPEATHAKKPELDGLFSNKKKWAAVKDVLDFKDEGKSIFNRKKSLVDASLKRIEAGLIKFAPGGKKAFLAKYYGSGHNISSIDEPAGTIVTRDRFSKIQPIILNPSHGGHCTGTDVPCVVIVARQDKAPLYLIQFKVDPNFQIPIYEDDTEVMIRIKRLMALFGLSDIKMRMLKISELLVIQDFPAYYLLFGNQADQKKFIGNSVVPRVVTVWCETLAEHTRLLRLQAA